MSIDVFELDEIDSVLIAAIEAYQEVDVGKRDLVLDLTTVMPKLTSVYDPLHPENTPHATDQDYYNTMRTIGYGWYSEVPWDVFPKNPSDSTPTASKRWWQIWK